MSVDRRRPARLRQRGFTLIEVVVATAIAALALVGLFHVASGGIFAVDTASRVEDAVERARSHLAALGREAPLAEGEAEGDDGGGFRWRRAVHALARRAPPNGLAGGATAQLMSVEIVISWREQGRRKAVTLTTLRLHAAS